MGGKILKIPLVSLVPKPVILCLFVFYSGSCPQAYRGGGCPWKLPLDGAKTSYQKFDTTLQLSVFCQLLFWSRSPQMSENTSKWGLNKIYLISNISSGVFSLFPFSFLNILQTMKHILVQFEYVWGKAREYFQDAFHHFLVPDTDVPETKQLVFSMKLLAISSMSKVRSEQEGGFGASVTLTKRFLNSKKNHQSKWWKLNCDEKDFKKEKKIVITNCDKNSKL